MLRSVFKELFSRELPDWFRVMNFGMLLLVLLWPFVLFMTIFMFDQPDSGTTFNYVVFFIINAYPFYLFPILYYNTKLFQKNRLLGSLLPVMMALAVAGAFLLIRLDAYL
jgi:hypothetical protein